MLDAGRMGEFLSSYRGGDYGTAPAAAVTAQEERPDRRESFEQGANISRSAPQWRCVGAHGVADTLAAGAGANAPGFVPVRIA